jgi:predicted nucleotidyltransferase
MATEVQRAADRLAKDPRVLGVYAFGSRAEGTAGSSSDIDVAALLHQALDLAEELRLRSAVVDELGRDDIDLVVLNQAPPLLRYEVLAHGKLLFSRDEERLQEFEERTLREYLDTSYLRATQQALTRSRDPATRSRP